jgi:hypothetical protein
MPRTTTVATTAGMTDASRHSATTLRNVALRTVTVM